MLLVAFLYLFRLDAGSPLLASDDEQCTKWPPYKTDLCHEMIPLDEIHYVPDARDVLRFGTESDTRVPTDDDGAFVVHPPVGKWLIAAGIAIVGDEPVGWRLFNALAGVLGVWLCFSLARRLLGKVRWAMLAALFLAIDGLWFTMSRVAMLDIASGVATLAAIRVSLEVVARAAEDSPRNLQRIFAGVLWGLALATKWSTASFAVAAGVVMLIAEISCWQRRSRIRHDANVEVQVFGRDALQAWADTIAQQRVRRRTGSGRAVLVTIASLSILPALTYVSTFAPWFASDDRYLPPRCEQETPLLSAWWCYQVEQLDFHRNLSKYEAVEEDEDEEESPSPTGTGDIPIETEDPTPIAASTPGHPYFGHGISWAWVGRPVVHAYASEDLGEVERAREVMSVPNPILWWMTFFAGLPWLIASARRSRTSRLLLLLFGAGWLPYLIADLVDRPVFLFYATPLVPIIAITAASFLGRLWDGPEDGTPNPIARGAVLGLIVATIGTFAWLYPIHAAAPLPLDRFGWSARIWFTTDCTVDAVKVLCWI